MTHSPDFGAESRRRFSEPTSGLCIIPNCIDIFVVILFLCLVYFLCKSVCVCHAINKCNLLTYLQNSGADRLHVLFRADFWTGIHMTIDDYGDW